MANVWTPRGAWVGAALQALAAGGPDAVRVEALAARLGVSKGGGHGDRTRSELLQLAVDRLLGDSWE